MEELQKAFLKNIKESPSCLSVKNIIDLALLSKKKALLVVSKNQYIELLGSFGFFLNNKNVLLCGDKETKESSPDGFYSVYNRLMDKFSLSLYSNFKNILVVIFVCGSEKVYYKKTTKNVIIDQRVSFNQLIKHLKSSGYEQVDKVESVKQFCLKGGIIDLFSPIYQNPIRAYFYNDLVDFIFYHISTGLPIKEKIKFVHINKQEKRTGSINLKPLFKNEDFMVIDASLSSLAHKQTNNIVPLNEQEFNKGEFSVFFSDRLFFSAYKFNNKIYAPIIYQKISVPTPTSDDFVVGFERGDLVCHEDFGVGLFGGFSQEDDEFVKIKYSDGTINLAVSQLFRLSFVSRETQKNIKITALNKKGLWKRKNTSVQLAAKKFVDNLVNMYANKKTHVRPPFFFGGELEVSFLKAFKYVETKDQETVWQELASDLGGEFPMSRLLCGDVGFGKTELAIRASFRVVVNGGQVVILCPTSILVSQHLGVFSERLSLFGVEVSSLIGGATLVEKTKIKNKWLDKKIDVLISTSSALYDDVFIKFASFFVVDEEHRFGVKQKEVLVNKFVNKDVLFMSATPIPRTLHLSLSGIHSISTLSTPPISRKPINTIVSYFSENLIKQAVYFELSRGGQLFYLHNKISTIPSIKSFLINLCPTLKVGVVHSRLGSKKIKKTVLDFINKKYNLLLCSSVIGSGIDIPNANTIFIDNAHLFGLSQLHQIRGRVGRAGAQGFAYLLLPKQSKLTVSGKKRLLSIEQNSSLGSGYALSRSDLEIRGGGSVFGYKQSGSIYDVGYEYYSKVVSRCFEAQTKKTSFSAIDSFNYKVSFVCCFSKNYISLDYERLRAYKTLAGLYSLVSVDSFEKKLKHVYGPISINERNLLNMRRVSVLCGFLNINNLVYSRGALVLFFNNNFIGVDYLVKFLGLYKTNLNVLSFVFGVVAETTKLTVSFKDTFDVDGVFLKLFIGSLNDFCEK